MTTATGSTTVRVETDVAAPPERAFRVFTDGIQTWWEPSHHLYVSETPLVSMTFEPHVGGAIVDRYADGRECRWARVLVFEPPTRLAFSWDIRLDWQLEADPTRASEVHVAFEPLDGGERTRVVLEHRHLDRHGEGWTSMRDAVQQGWTLDAFAAAAAA